MWLFRAQSESGLSKRLRYTSAGSQLSWTPTVFLPLCTFGVPRPGNPQSASPRLSTSFSAPPAGVADSLPGFNHEVDTVWNFTVFAWMACLPGWQWVGEEKRGISLIGLFPLCTQHGVIEDTGPPLSPGMVLQDTVVQAPGAAL